MSRTVYTRVVGDEDAYTQKCRIPLCLLNNCYIKAGNVVSITCEFCSYICRVFPYPLTESELCISIDDAISYNSSIAGRIDQSFKIYNQLVFPDDFKVVKTTVFDKLQVTLVLREETQVISIEKKLYCNVVSNLLLNFIVTKNAIVKCVDHQLANSFHIHSILISETFLGEHVFGRLTKATVIEIIEVVSKKQLNQLKKLENIDVGGIEDAKKLLSFYLLKKTCRKVIVLGPSGCGKSVFIKKFCSDYTCYLIAIDGMKDCSLTKDKCDEYYKQLIKCSTFFPNHLNILLIDHIDRLASSDAKRQQKSNVPALIYLFECLKNTNVSIIAIATQKKFVHPSVSRLFEEEVFLGIPSFGQRKEILLALTKSFPNNHTDCDKIAGMTPGFIACDMVQLVQEASKVRKNIIQFQGTSKNLELPDNMVLTTQDFETALLSVSPSVLKTSKWNLKVKPVYWKDIGGMDQIKKRLQLSIEKPLLHPEIFQKVDLHCPRGVLLFGPPGCCKTTLARGLATACNANFFAANPSQIYSSYVGESEKNIVQLFYQARLCSPSIIFLDELDGLVGCRTFDTKQQGVAEKVLSTLLNEMDGLGTKTHFGEKVNSSSNLEDEVDVVGKNHLQDEVIVVAATNRPDCIDDALLRPGRFDIILYVPAPNLEERESILHTVTNGTPLHNVNLKKIAEKTEFFTGADLKNLCNVAAMNALRQDMLNAEYVTQADFMQALEKLQPSITKEQVQMYEQLSNKYGPVISD